MEQRFLDINKRPTSFRRPTLNLRPPFHPQQIRSPDENSIHQDAIKLFWSSAIGFFGKDINISGSNNNQSIHPNNFKQVFNFPEDSRAQIYLGKSRFLMSPYYFFRTHWPIVSTDVHRQHSSSSSVNWLRNKPKPVFCTLEKTFTGYPVIKQPKQADYLDLRPTEDEKHLILDLHNQLRQNVASGNEKRGSPGPQPAAAFMPNLV